MDTRRSILQKIGSWPITHWVMRKLLAVKWRRMHKAPEVQQRIKAISAAAPHIQEQFEAFVSYTMTLQNKLARSKLIEVDALPPGTIQIVQLLCSVIKIKSAPHRWSVPSAHAPSEWLFGRIGPRWIAIDSSM